MKKNRPLNEIIAKKGYDPFLLEEIQPQGGISFKDERYIKTGNGYEACIKIYMYPKHLDTHWLATSLNNANTVVSIDISNEDMNEVKKNINKSIQEQTSRYNTSKNATDITDAQQRYNELSSLYQEISNMGEIVKLISIRIFIATQTLDEADKQAKGIINFLESNGYKASIYLNETKSEWQSIYESYTQNQTNEYKQYGQPILSETLAGGNPFHFTSLKDPLGTYLGKTTTGGSVLFDMFHIDNNRKSYNGLVLGAPGAGKSTLLKFMLLDTACRGNFIRGFDVTGEFSDLVSYLGGVNISLDGVNGILNALEILKADESESISFAMHLSKLNTVYKLLVPNHDPYEVVEFEQQMREFYSHWGIIDDSKDLDTQQITGRKSKDYPIWSDFRNFLSNKIKENSTKNHVNELEIVKLKRINNIYLIITNLIDNYGYMFNGHTSIDNIMDTQIVFFQMRNLTSMKTEIFDVQIFITLSICWSNCLTLGQVMKDKWENGSIGWEDITRFMIFIDEAHRIINANKLTAVEMITAYEREDRKYFGGILMATHNIRDFVPEGSKSEAIDTMKTLFELCQYKFIMQQDANSLDILNRVFSREITPSQIQDIPRFGKGDTVLIISGDKNIQLNINITEEEKAIFKGGA